MPLVEGVPVTHRSYMARSQRSRGPKGVPNTQVYRNQWKQMLKILNSLEMRTERFVCFDTTAVTARVEPLLRQHVGDLTMRLIVSGATYDLYVLHTKVR